jgi:dCMP deaminase
MTNVNGDTLSFDRQSLWDARFLDLAEMVSSWSKDTSTKVGAVVVTPEKVVVSVGYNGFAQRMPDTPEHYENRDEKLSRIVHAETNAILLARRDVRGYTMYSTFPPCDRCAVLIIQAGISRLVCPALDTLSEDADGRWGKSMETARRYFYESGVAFVEVEGAVGKLTLPSPTPAINTKRTPAPQEEKKP